MHCLHHRVCVGHKITKSKKKKKKISGNYFFEVTVMNFHVDFSVMQLKQTIVINEV